MSLVAPPSRPTPRPWVSRHRYRIRRLAALTVLVAVGAGAAKVVVDRCRRQRFHSTPAATWPTRPTAPTDPVDTAATDDRRSSRRDTPRRRTPPTEPPPEDTGPPTAENPAVVLHRRRQRRRHVRARTSTAARRHRSRRHRRSTTRCRPAWPVPTSSTGPPASREQVPAVDPDIVVVTFGGNDAQGLLDAVGGVVAFQPVPDADNADWRAEYGKRVGEVMDFLVERRPHGDLGRHPQRRQPRRHGPHAGAGRDRPRPRRPSARRSCSSTPGTGSPAATAAGPSTSIDPRDGIGKDVRADDGFHLNENGAEILALDIAEAIKSRRPPRPRRAI